ncbi:MAG: prephenate dehydratase domain-containing protein, partial [Pseudomonadales bacterium]
IVSHAQSLAQCRGWLDANYSGIERVAVTSNAEAALQASNDPKIGAVAGEMAAERYALRVVASNVEDHTDNKTRFLVLGRQYVGPSGRDKTSILVSTKNEPGALFKVLEPFDRHDISLTRIETRPARSGDWSYVFFIDFDGHKQDTVVQTALADVQKVALEVRSLGSYPQAVI